MRPLVRTTLRPDLAETRADDSYRTLRRVWRLLLVGLVACGSSTVRWERPDGVAQEARRVRAELERCPEGGSHCDCDSDRDCDARPGGECHRGFPGGGSTGYDPGLVQTCRYAECATHADCGEGMLCVPGGFISAVSWCIVASCRRNADCAAGTSFDGRCGILMGRLRPEAHCVFPEHECGHPDQLACGPETDEYGTERSRSCRFVDGHAQCVVDPEPVP